MIITPLLWEFTVLNGEWNHLLCSSVFELRLNILECYETSKLDDVFCLVFVE